MMKQKTLNSLFSKTLTNSLSVSSIQPMDSSANPNCRDAEKVNVSKKTNRKKMKDRSLVWEHFEKNVDEDGVVQAATCKYCKLKYNCHTKKNGTSTLWAHINKCVSGPTVKRRTNVLGITWQSHKKRKQSHDAMEEEPSYSPNLQRLFKQAGHGHAQKVSKGATGTTSTVKKLAMESDIESNMEVHKHTEVHLDCEIWSNIAEPNGSSRIFDFVKVCYKKLKVKIDSSLISSVDELKEFVSKTFELEMNKFKIEYLDEEKEWYLMTSISNLDDALLHTSPSGKKFIMLSITDKDISNTGKHSEKVLEEMIPTKSEGNSSQPLNRYSFPFDEFCVAHIKPLIEGHIDVKADGNCGFRVIATFEYGDEEKWLDVRFDLLKELKTNMDLYKKALGGDEEFERAKSMVNWFESPAQERHWFEATCLGLVVATKYQKVFTYWSNECCTYLPLVSRSVDHKPPTMFINMARINENHFIALKMPTNIPLPQLHPNWKHHCYDTVKHWSTIIIKKKS